MRVIVPPIKSQGIKTKLVPWIQALVPRVAGRWFEPFFGTGVVAFNSGFSEAVLSDNNPHIISFYKAIQDGRITPAVVRDYLEAEGESLRSAGDEGYDHYRTISQRFNREHDCLDFLFLSRAGFNGMMRFNKSGGWNIPFCKKPNRFSKAYVTKITNQVHDVSRLIKPGWLFMNESYKEIIPLAGSDDIIYCDPPYLGRYVDYFNGWSEEDEKTLYELLSSTKAKFILSTWHHNDHRSNEMIPKYWDRFNIVTRDHFYHSGGKIENRQSIVEALVFNFEAGIKQHNHDIEIRQEQLVLLEERARYIADQVSQYA